MDREIIKEMLQNRYHSLAYTNQYILAYKMKGVVYFTLCNSEIVDKVTSIEHGHVGDGFALRFKPNMVKRRFLMAQNCTVLCSEKFLVEMTKNSKYNNGDNVERLISEYYGQTWTKNSVPFTKAGDIVINGISYQIKYEDGTFTNERQLAGLEN